MAHKNTVAMETSSSSPYLAVARNGATDLATSLATQQAHDMVGGVVVKTERQLRRERRRRKRWTVVVAIVCLSAFFVGLAAMIVHATLVAYLAFVFPLFTGPYAIRQRRKLNKLPTLVNVLNQIRETANVLLFENDKLHAENNRLAHQVSRLNQAETKLSALAEKSGSNVAAICDLVKENAAAMKQMKVRRLLLVYILVSLFYVFLSSR